MITKLVSWLLRLTRHNAGNVPGRVALKLAPQIRQALSVTGKIIVVTGTNGKTTTAGMIAEVLRRSGYKVVANSGGNNIDWGITTTLLQHATLAGRIECDFLVLETDEHWVPVLYKQRNLRADTIVVLDFFRDQLDRAGEMETIVAKLEKFVAKYPCRLVLNGDDPNVVRIGRANARGENHYYGAGRLETSYTKPHDKMEGIICPYCKVPLKYTYYQYSHLGKFKCPHCGYQNAELQMKLKKLNADGAFWVDDRRFVTQDANLYNIYNILAVMVVAQTYEISDEIVQAMLTTHKNRNGRGQIFAIRGHWVVLDLCKNPTGYNVVLRPLKRRSGRKELLMVLNDHVNDGEDVSWIWDIDLTDMRGFERIICSGTRAYDMAIPVKCNGYAPERMIVRHDKKKAVRELLTTLGDKYVISNYSALAEMRQILLNEEKRK